MLRLIFRFVFTCMLVSCAEHVADSASDSETGDPLLIGKSWKLETSEVELVAEAHITLQLQADGSLSGSDGCNQYAGTYTVDKTRLHVSDMLINGIRMCESQIDDMAEKYKKQLLSVETYAITNHQLTLYGANQNPLIFKAQSVDLAGSTWTVISYNNGRQAVITVLNGTQLTVTFGEDGKISGSAGCNQYFARYQQTDNTIVVSQPASSRRACLKTDGIMEQEATFLSALTSATQLQQTANRLILRAESGAIALTLERQN